MVNDSQEEYDDEIPEEALTNNDAHDLLNSLEDPENESLFSELDADELYERIERGEDYFSMYDY